ncbi:MAG: enoyl-CoA hydratase/isomerase family protein [Flavobacteriales bacterium]|nr:enoyl-CoA hydratase/isomerase family protein [Flavobacteriales bacterium]
MKTYNNILFTVADGVATITMNREAVLNSFNFPMADDVIDALTFCKDNDSIRAIIFTGNGRGFCAGQDLEEATREGAPKIEEIVDHTYNPIINLLRTIEKPIIGAVNGVAAGAGANIAFACDVTFAARSAKFIQSFSNIGLVPDSGGTYTLPRLVGMQRAAAFMFMADKVSADEAAAMGMIYKAVDDEALMTEVSNYAKILAQRPTKGIGLTKRALNESFTNSFEQQLGVERALQAEAGQTYDHKEGIKAFFEKRKPEYKGC